MAAADPEHDGRHKDKLRGRGPGRAQPGFARLPLPASVEYEERHRAPYCQQTKHHSEYRDQTSAALVQPKAVAMAQLAQVVCLSHIEHQQEEAAEHDRCTWCARAMESASRPPRRRRTAEGPSSGSGARGTDAASRGQQPEQRRTVKGGSRYFSRKRFACSRSRSRARARTASALCQQASQARARCRGRCAGDTPLTTRVRQPSGVQRYGPRTAASIQTSHPNPNTKPASSE